MSHPGPFTRQLFRAPTRLYEHGLGWILGRRFVCPASDWFRNLQSGSGAKITVGRSTFAADSRVLETAEPRPSSQTTSDATDWSGPSAAPTPGSGSFVNYLSSRSAPRRRVVDVRVTAERTLCTADPVLGSGPRSRFFGRQLSKDVPYLFRHH